MAGRSAVGLREFVVGTGGGFMTGTGFVAGGGQRGGAEPHLRRPQADPPRLELRLAVRPNRGKEVERLRLGAVPRSGGVSDRRSSSTRADGRPHPADDYEPPARAAPLQAPHGVPLHPLGAGVRAVRPRAPPCRSALSAGREVHADGDSGDQHASVPLRRGRQASQAWQVQGQGRGSRSRWQLLHAGESEVPDRSLTSPLARSTLAAGPASQGR